MYTFVIFSPIILALFYSFWSIVYFFSILQVLSYGLKCHDRRILSRLMIFIFQFLFDYTGSDLHKRFWSYFCVCSQGLFQPQQNIDNINQRVEKRKILSKFVHLLPNNILVSRL